MKSADVPRFFMLLRAFECLTATTSVDYVDLCAKIIGLSAPPGPVDGNGKSTYAKRRRAKKIGRCYRCFRVDPKFYYTTRCDGVSCVPGIKSNYEVQCYIRLGKRRTIELFEARELVIRSQVILKELELDIKPK
ncbi:nucleic acid binding protein [Birch carlavirus]|uniref:RNA silencing suppressor n=1 Tax=Birch carlavirus TaxID=2248769 RepID=A0AAE5YGG1_9VIRU|nr:nucleic acid binding protein [Birch carlavirus]QBJ27543.1 nucleic acid binding protein [Birch carlavirus]